MSDNEQKSETVDDVLAEMLERADAMQTHGTTHGVKLAIREFVNRIKAAWKRERAKVEADSLAVGGIVEAARHKPVGNAAAMREALVDMVEAETEGSMDRDDLCGRCFEKMWNSCKHDGSCWVDKVINALSAPARNCDLYDDAETARQAWLDDADNWDDFGSPKLELPEWLFASAKKKGENDGIK